MRCCTFPRLSNWRMRGDPVFPVAPVIRKVDLFMVKKKAALANTGAAFMISFRNILLQFLLHLDDLVAFDGVAHFNVIVVFNGQAAFQSGAYFLDIVLEALE